MNLHLVVTPAVSAINPPVIGVLWVSTGYTSDTDGTQLPTYAQQTGVSMQVQALTAKDLEQLDSLNIQGAQRAVYMNGFTRGLDRATKRGGDVLAFPNGTYWLVLAELEEWETPGWSKVAVRQQVTAPA